MKGCTDMQRTWTDGRISQLVCRKCGKGVLLPNGDCLVWSKPFEPLAHDVAA